MGDFGRECRETPFPGLCALCVPSRPIKPKSCTRDITGAGVSHVRVRVCCRRVRYRCCARDPRGSAAPWGFRADRRRSIAGRVKFPLLRSDSELRALAVAAALAACATTASRAEDPLPSADRLKSSPVLQHLRPNPMKAAPLTGPERTVSQMHVPEGFRVELALGEPDLHQPVAFAWQDRGRRCVSEASSYPTTRAEGQGLVKLVIF